MIDDPIARCLMSNFRPPARDTDVPLRDRLDPDKPANHKVALQENLQFSQFPSVSPDPAADPFRDAEDGGRTDTYTFVHIRMSKKRAGDGFSPDSDPLNRLPAASSTPANFLHPPEATTVPANDTPRIGRR
ncbi:MAG: hypothetical protein KF787_11300 [Phycisphaeraceae bacterium]|nr:hypothetical protein [Phycisphaerae bacterium]MBX3393222.1 hypothetical protein [Phycisphaeraceae bacterium]